MTRRECQALLAQAYLVRNHANTRMAQIIRDGVFTLDEEIEYKQLQDKHLKAMREIKRLEDILRKERTAE